jgi:hypothetical protein
VPAERRPRAARDLASTLVEAYTAEEVCERARGVLRSDTADLPFALLYLLDTDGQRARLARSVGLSAGSSLAPPAVDLTGEQGEAEAGEGATWPLGRAARANRRAVVEGLATRWGDETVRGGHELTPHSAMALPVTEPGPSSSSAILIAA